MLNVPANAISVFASFLEVVHPGEYINSTALSQLKKGGSVALEKPQFVRIWLYMRQIGGLEDTAVRVNCARIQSPLARVKTSFKVGLKVGMTHTHPHPL